MDVLKPGLDGSSRQPPARPMILDGGLATWAEALGAELDPQLWSAGLLIDSREILSRVYQAFLDAGADCVATATYQASFPGLSSKGIEGRKAEALLEGSVELARRACGRFWSGRPPGRQRPLVAASVGPYGAYLADGSEYRGDYEIDAAGIRQFHRRRLECLAATKPDWIALETIPSALEIRVLVELLEGLSTLPPVWLALSCRSETELADGTPLEDLGDLFEHPTLAAVGVNCCAPSRADGVLSTLGNATSKPLVVYPNSGEIYSAEASSWQGPSQRLEERVKGWLAAGAGLLGGCCRTTPEDIARLRAAAISS